MQPRKSVRIGANWHLGQVFMRRSFYFIEKRKCLESREDPFAPLGEPDPGGERVEERGKNTAATANTVPQSGLIPGTHFFYLEGDRGLWRQMNENRTKMIVYSGDVRGRRLSPSTGSPQSSPSKVLRVPSGSGRPVSRTRSRRHQSAPRGLPAGRIP